MGGRVEHHSVPLDSSAERLLASADTELKTMQPSGCSTCFTFYHFLQMSAVSTDEDGIGAGKRSEVGVQEISGYRRNAWRAEAAGVGVHQLFSFGAYLEGDDGEMRKLQAGFDGDGTGTETDVPEDAAAVQFQCLQGEQADGSLGYHAGASVKMCKLFIGDAEGTD